MTATLAPAPKDTARLRRGACPSVATPMQTGDGLLVRLRPVAPAMTARDLFALASLSLEHGNGLIEITARGNLQLRGLTEASVPRLAAGLAAAGIAVQTGVAIEVPPLAGVDPSEIADATPVADALRAALAGSGLALAPKLSIVIDGGGVFSLADMVADIRLDAVRIGNEVAWRLAVGGDRLAAKAVAVLPPPAAVEGTMAVVAALAAIGPAARGRDLDLATLVPAAEAAGALAVPPAAALGSLVAPTLGPQEIGGEIVLGLAPAYGQVNARQLLALAEGFSEFIGEGHAAGGLEYRLAPHHGMLVRGLSRARLPEAMALAREVGFWSSAEEPGRAISVCAGAAGCASGTFDTRAAADALVALAGPLLDGSVHVHISGCQKGCAHPSAAAVTLCGSAAGIGLVLGGRAGDRPGATVPRDRLRPALQRLGTVLRARQVPGEAAATVLDRTTPATLFSAYQGNE
jgi:precorrin-3B synthase